MLRKKPGLKWILFIKPQRTRHQHIRYVLRAIHKPVLYGVTRATDRTVKFWDTKYGNSSDCLYNINLFLGAFVPSRRGPISFVVSVRLSLCLSVPISSARTSYIFVKFYTENLMFIRPCIVGSAVAQWLMWCATNRKVAGSIPDGVIGIFHWHNPSDRAMALGSTQPLTEMSTRRISWG